MSPQPHGGRGIHRRLGPGAFIALFTLYNYALRLALLPVALALGVGGARDVLGEVHARTGLPALALLAVIVAPVLETLAGQVLPVYAVSRFTRSKVAQIAAATALFAALHVGYGAAYALLLLPTALLLAIAYRRWLDASFGHAFCVTVAIHALVNGIAVAFQALA